MYYYNVGMSFSWVRPLRFSALQLLSFTALILERGQVDVQRVQLRDAILIRALPASLKNTAFLTLYGMIRKVDITFIFFLSPREDYVSENAILTARDGTFAQARPRSFRILPSP